MATIHDSAIVDSQADLAEDVQIGPWCVLQGPVRLAPGVRLMAHVYLKGPIEIGEGTIVWPFAALGAEPQDFKFRPGDPSAGVWIGPGCLIREHATVHAATSQETPTRVGAGVFIMQNSHVGHDASIADHAILVNGALIAGHAQVGERANISGNTSVHQFTRVGRLAMLSGNVGISLDLPPFCVSRLRNTIAGVNVIGMRRAGFSAEEIRAMREAFRRVLRPILPRRRVLDELRARARDSIAVAELAEFVASSKRGICPAERRASIEPIAEDA